MNETDWIFPLATHGSYSGRKRVSAHRTPASLFITHTGFQLTQPQLPLSHCWLSDYFYLWCKWGSRGDQQVSWSSGKSHVEGKCVCVFLVLHDVLKAVCTLTVALDLLCLLVMPTFWHLESVLPCELQTKLTGIRVCLEPRTRGRLDGSGALGCERHMQTL